MPKAIKKTKRVAPAKPPQSKPFPPNYQDPAALPDEYALRLGTDHLEPAYPKGCYLVIDKRQPCEKGDLVVVYPTPEAVRRGGHLPLVTHLATVLAPGWKLPFRLAPGSEVRPVLLTSHVKDAPKCRALDVETMQAIYRVTRIASPDDVQK